MPQALVNCEPLPPEYHQDNELLLPPKYEQELIEEEQQCENELLGNGQHGTYGVQHGVQYSDQENAYCEQEESTSSDSEMEEEGDTGLSKIP